MKVLYLTNIPSPYRVGFFQELGNYCDLTVLYELKAARDRDKDWKGKEEERTYREIFLSGVIKLTSSAWCPEVIRYLKDRSYDIVVVGGYSTPTGMHALRYLKRCRIPYILNSDGGFAGRGEPCIKKKLKTYFISNAQAYLSTGRECDKYLIYYGAEKTGIYHYPFTSLHEADIIESILKKEEKIKLRKELGIIEEKVILSVGSFIPRKGFDILMLAARNLDKTYGIYIIGGIETEEYKEIRKQYELNTIHFLPFLKSKELRKYYHAADLFAFPTREDIWGLVINEAMAAGLPVVTTEKCIAGLELLKQCGKIVPVGNVQAMAEAIRQYFENEAAMEKAAEDSLKKIREYTIENMADVHMKIFKEVLNAKLGK